MHARRSFATQDVTVKDAVIPALGFGTFELDEPTAERMVTTALEQGYRHIDTAQIYRNEAAVGRALAGAGVPRSEIFLTTKVWMDNFRDGDLQRSARESLERLDSDYVDLLLLHWPSREVPLAETLSALNDCRDQGLVRHIGVSNFPTDWLEAAVAQSRGPLVTNQVEYHPFLDQTPVLGGCRRHDISVTAYSPVARGKTVGNPTLAEIGRRHGKNEVQVSLRWLIQQPGVIAIPRSADPDHARANLDIFDFELSEAEMAEISALGSPEGRLIDPSFAPEWDRAA